MRNFFLALSMAALAVSSAQAASVSIQGDDGLLPGESGVLQVVVDTSDNPDVSFANGGIGLDLSSDTPGIIRIDDFQVHTPGSGPFSRWSGSGGTVNGDGIEDLNAFSVQTLGFDDAFMNPPNEGDPEVGGEADRFLFATINYTALDDGMTTLSFAPAASRGVDALVSKGVDVASTTTLNSFKVTVIPEPTTLMLAGLGLIGFVGTRRRS